MNCGLVIYFLFLLVTLCSTLFLFKGKEEPIIFCLKICPLYCSTRRHDVDASSFIYDDEPNFEVEPEFEIPYRAFVYCKPWPKPTTTTTTTTTTTPEPTTEEPTTICLLCKKKCNYPKS